MMHTPKTIADRPAIIEQAPTDDFRQRLARVYRKLEDYLLTRDIPSPILEETPEGEGVK